MMGQLDASAVILLFDEKTSQTRDYRLSNHACRLRWACCLAVAQIAVALCRCRLYRHRALRDTDVRKEVMKTKVRRYKYAVDKVMTYFALVFNAEYLREVCQG